MVLVEKVMVSFIQNGLNNYLKNVLNPTLCQMKNNISDIKNDVAMVKNIDKKLDKIMPHFGIEEDDETLQNWNE